MEATLEPLSILFFTLFKTGFKEQKARKKIYREDALKKVGRTRAKNFLANDEKNFLGFEKHRKFQVFGFRDQKGQEEAT